MKSLEIKLERDRKTYEEGIIKKIREEETKRQQDFDKKLKEKLLEAKENMVVNKRMRAQEKKKKIGFHSVAKSMSSLIRRIEDVNDKNDIITPDSSDMDDESPRTNTKIQIKNNVQVQDCQNWFCFHNHMYIISENKFCF